MKKIVSVFLVLIVAIAACKKDRVIPAEEKTNLELLTNSSSKSWKLKDGVAKQNGLEVNLIASQNGCITDNVIKLFSDFKYEFYEGAVKCNVNDPDLILKATWSLSADSKTITIDKFIFLGFVVDKPAFLLSNVTASSFAGTTTLTVNNETFDLNVVFEEVK
jgi:hypothetical protein